MPPLRLQTFAASARIARTDLAEVEAAFDEDIKTLEAASSPRNVGATPSKGAAAADGSPGVRPETECMPVLSFCLSFLDMGPIFTDRDTYRLAEAAASSTPYSTQLCVIPVSVDLSDLSRDAVSSLQSRALDAVNATVNCLPRLDAFSLWHVVLPKSPKSPYRRCLLDLVSTAHPQLRLKALAVVHSFVSRTGGFFSQVSGRRGGGTSSFIPVYASLAESLEEAHLSLCESIERSADFCFITSAAKTLALLVRKCPYERLASGDKIVSRVIRTSGYLIEYDNPVSQIAGLNLLLSMLSLSLSEKVLPAAVVDDSYRMLLNIAYPNKNNSRTLDNNVRYVALQNLGQLVSVNFGPVGNNVDVLQASLEGVFLLDRDGSIVLHSLRLFRLLAKHEPVPASSSFSSGRPPPPLMQFWLAFLRPRVFQLVEERGDPTLKAALCDCLSAIGEHVYQHLPLDKRHLYLTYLLSHCDTRCEVNVRQSAFRGLGMIVTFDFALTDPNFLLDCADKICSAMEQRCSKNIAVNVTWALSNLCDALLLLHSQNLDVFHADYPKCEIVKILAETTKYTADGFSNHHMNIRVNCLRSVGCLLRVCDGTYFEDDSVRVALLKFAVQGAEIIERNLRQSPVMKVRWNAAYATSKVIQNDHLGQLTGWHGSLVAGLIDATESCKNFKVKINSVAALLCVRRPEPLKGLVSRVFSVIFGVMESVEGEDATTVVEVAEDGETKHKLDLMDNLCLAIAHLATIVEVSDLEEVCTSLLPSDRVHFVRYCNEHVRKRLSPEKISTFLEAATRLQESGRRSALSPLLEIIRE